MADFFKLKYLIILSLALFFQIAKPEAQASGVQWSGRYTVEGLRLSNPRLDSSKKSKSYALHHLVLRPEIIPADGFILRSRLDIFNQSQLANSQMGQVFGSLDASNTNNQSSTTMGSTQFSDTVAVNELYLTWAQEFGTLVVGRTPIHFGLGMRYNAGNGDFDHWFDNRDMIAYKLQLGNFFVMPMVAKISENLIDHTDDLTDYMLQAEYYNPDSELGIGVMYRSRRSNSGGNDSNPNLANPPPPTPSTQAVVDSNYRVDETSIFLKQKVGTLHMGLEGGFVSGNTGLKAANGNDIKQNGFGVALELDWKKAESPWSAMLNAGMASGDDPSTTDRYEGFTFSRNYDVAFMMFNHLMGNNGLDIFHTASLRKTAATATNTNQMDVDAISNVLYLAPQVRYTLSDKWSFGGTLATGFLQKEGKVGASKKGVGYELDLGVNFTPNERVKWVTQFGLFMPGGAYRGTATDSFETATQYGITTKAAINF